MQHEILFGIIALVAVFCIIVAMRPAAFRVTRSIKIAASPDVIFPHINALRKWQTWSPWARLDPNAVTTFEGPEEGTDGVMYWKGNSQVGEGHTTTVESISNELVRFQLDFVKPMKATNYAEFKLVPDGNQTTVSWTMYGKNNFMSKAVGLFMNCDKMIGTQFEKGLQNLKGIIEHS